MTVSSTRCSSGGLQRALVAIGAALLGFAAGAAGTFLFLRKRALVSDAVAHATLPGVGLAVHHHGRLRRRRAQPDRPFGGFGGNGGSAFWRSNGSTRRTRLAEDAAIGAVLSVFFGSASCC
jgi:manganese/zinc/iron transport system permease protein